MLLLLSSEVLKAAPFGVLKQNIGIAAGVLGVLKNPLWELKLGAHKYIA